MFAVQEMHAVDILAIQQLLQQPLLVGHIGGEQWLIEAIPAKISQRPQISVANLQMAHDIAY